MKFETNKRIHRKTAVILAAIVLLSPVLYAQINKGPDKAEYRIGVSSRSFENINRNDASAALKAWAVTIGREQKIQERFEIELYNSLENMTTAFRNDELDAVSVSVDEFLHLGVKPESIYLPSTSTGYNVRYCLVVHSKDGITDPAGAVNRRIVTSEGPQMVLAPLWLESLLGAGRKTGEFITTENPSKAILRVFFRQTPVGLTTLDAFELSCELNPQLRRDLTVLAVSRPFITTLFLFNPNFTGPLREKLERALLDIHTTPGGRQVLTVFKSSWMVKMPVSVLNDTLQFLTDTREKGGTIENGR